MAMVLFRSLRIEVLLGPKFWTYSNVPHAERNSMRIRGGTPIQTDLRELDPFQNVVDLNKERTKNSSSIIIDELIIGV